MLYIVSRSIDQGRTAGLLSALGVTTGTLVHIAAAAIGLSSLVLASTVAFDAVRYAGAAYLVFLGVRRLLTRHADTLVEERAPRSLRRLYTQGVVVNLLNPKTIVFIFAFIPQFVDVDAGHVGVQILLLGLTLAGLGLHERQPLRDRGRLDRRPPARLARGGALRALVRRRHSRRARSGRCVGRAKPVDLSCDLVGRPR